ncbi:hypothetical protein TTRE_0000818401 [Trichuris trichiura]|uniref:Uncharacterized protein n=1 Tax=Trichuris trichiura TaxID=36087 RepID=A0A077ZJK5_TRITR|nr:hypothetical protein TTRE_0000818401 [Trichuris trichiura]
MVTVQYGRIDPGDKDPHDLLPKHKQKDSNCILESWFQNFFSRSANIGSVLRSDRAKVAIDQQPGTVSGIVGTCRTLYIRETGNTLSHQSAEHLGNLTKLGNAETGHMGLDIKTRDRPQASEPAKVMQKTLESSAVAEHAVGCKNLLPT